MENERWTDNTIMPFGKHRNSRLAEVPASYLLWCYKQKDMMKERPGLRAYIEEGMTWLESEAREEQRDKNQTELPF